MPRATDQCSPSTLRRFVGCRSLLGLVTASAVAVTLALVVQRRPPVVAHRDANVLLITLDTTRRDHLSCYGYQYNTSPNLDALAADGLLFERCIAASNWTLPTHASILTGLYPPRHGAHLLATDLPDAAALAQVSRNEYLHAGVLQDSCTTLAEVLRSAGRRTGAIVANHPSLQRAFQLDQGFDDYDDAPAGSPFPYRVAPSIADEAIRWLAKERTQPFFLFLNFMDPHSPYNPPDEYLSPSPSPDSPIPDSWKTEQDLWSMAGFQVMKHKRRLNAEGLRYFTARYDGEITYMDAHIGRILNWLRDHGLYDSTLIIVTADHGEGFGEHFIVGHGFRLYEPEVHVPLLVKLPGQTRTGRIDGPVHHVDVMPTVLQVLGRPDSEEIDGVSMLTPASRDLFVQQHVFPRLAAAFPWCSRSQWAVYRDPLKYIEYSNGDQELYDLDQDPGERSNLATSRSGDVRALHRALQQWKEEARPLQPPTPPSDLVPETAEQLRDLGYLH